VLLGMSFSLAFPIQGDSPFLDILWNCSWLGDEYYFRVSNNF